MEPKSPRQLRSRASQWAQKNEKSPTNSISSTRSSLKSKVLLPLTKNDGCQQIGVVSKGLNQLSTLPTLSLKLDSMTLADTNESDPSFEILCRNVQERPPLESYNEIKSPFLPCVNNQDKLKQYDINNPEKLAYVLSNQYDLWKTRVSNKSLSKGRYENIRDVVFHGCDQVPNQNKSCYNKKTISNLVEVLEENPLGPVNFYSSNCLIPLPANEKGTLAYSNHTSNVTISQ